MWLVQIVQRWLPLLACWMVHGVVAARPQIPSLDSESRGWDDSLAEPVHPWPTGSEGNRPRFCVTFWVAGRSLLVVVQVKHSVILHCDLVVLVTVGPCCYGIMLCCIVL